MSRSVPVQTNINEDITFYSRVPPAPTAYSTVLSEQWISTANLVADFINGIRPNDIGPLSSLTAAIKVSTPQAYISTINGAPPAQNEIAGPDEVLSTMTVSKYLSTKITEVGTVNSAPLITGLVLPQHAVVSTITSPIWMSTLDIAGGIISSISSTSLVGKPPGAALGGGMSVSTATLSTVRLNNNILSTQFKYFPGPILTGNQLSAPNPSTLVSVPYVFPGDWQVITKVTGGYKTEIQSPSSFIFHNPGSFSQVPIRWMAAGACGPTPF